MKKALLLPLFGICLIGFYAFTLVKKDQSENLKDGEPTSRSINFSEDIAPIYYQKCTGCHHNGGIAPFSLVTYQDAYDNRGMSEYMVTTGQMPPWPPDTTYQRYRHERILSPTEINTISSWVQGGAPQGDSILAPPYPTYVNNGPTLGTPDLTLEAPVYTSNALTQDDYVCFSIPSGLLQDKKIRAVEVEPGNPEIVHHCLVYIDESGTYQTDTSGGCMGPSGSAKLVGEFTPGSDPTVFPGSGNMNFGINMAAGSNVILAMHYPLGSLGMTDSTKVHFYFYPTSTSGFREISVAPILQNWSFCVDPNQVQSFDAEFPSGTQTTPLKSTVMGIFPHMHLLGKSIEAYAVSAANDTNHLVRINNWDFEWQGFYEFIYPEVIPAGSKVYGHATYDNTTANDHNPNIPPQTVCAGLNTTDEMFLVYFMYTNYQNGDEYLNLDSLAAEGGLSISEPSQNELGVVIYPNPVRDIAQFAIEMKRPGDLMLTVTDLNGRLVHEQNYSALDAGTQHISWNILDSDSPVTGGTYLIRFQTGDRSFYGKVVVQ